MYNDKRIACVVLNYNDAVQTLHFLENIKENTIIDVIIIVDNCSTDNSFQLLSTKECERIIVRRTRKNGGYGYGNNFGVLIAKREFSCDYAIIANPDVVFSQRLTEKIIEQFIEDSSLAICSAVQVNGFSGTEISNCAWRVPTYWDYIRCSLLLFNRLLKTSFQLDKKQDTQVVGCVPGAFLIVEVEKFIKLGGYDERVFLFCEESILGYRVKNAGYTTKLLTNCNYYHYHSTSIKKSIPKEIARHQIVLKSRLFYLDYYLKVSKLKHFFAKFIFLISYYEYKFLYIIRNKK